MEARDSRPLATEGLLNVTLFGWQPRCSTQGRAVFWREAEKSRQLRFYLETILNVTLSLCLWCFHWLRLCLG